MKKRRRFAFFGVGHQAITEGQSVFSSDTAQAHGQPRARPTKQISARIAKDSFGLLPAVLGDTGVALYSAAVQRVVLLPG